MEATETQPEEIARLLREDFERLKSFNKLIEATDQVIVRVEELKTK